MAVAKLNADNFDDTTKEGTTLIDFWAEWCGPCKALTPIIDELDAELGNNVTFAKVNVDEESELAQKFNIMSIPAIFILKDGEIVNQFVGVQTKQVLADAVNKVSQPGS